jgi:long-chain acyl-CoA synthetase
MITHFNRACNVTQFMWIFEPLWPGVKGKAAAEIAIPIFHAWGHVCAQAAIALGMRILLVSDPRDIRQTVSLLKENRPLIAGVVPTHLMKIAENQVGRLPVMFLSGAAPLPGEVFEAIKRDTLMPVTEGYGLTECGPITHGNLSCFSKITGFVTKERLGIGIPIPDTDVEIVDVETGEELGAGEIGEMVIRGPQLMHGYWPTPGSGLKDGWLHTGDIARMDEDGYFVLEDRIKDMANISGYKVYTTEVDEVLFTYPGVEMAATVGIPDPDRPGSERIKAFIRPKDGYKDKLNADDIIAYCKDKLPATAVPKFVEFRDELPLTVTDKIFKRFLREEEIKRMKEQGVLK